MRSELPWEAVATGGNHRGSVAAKDEKKKGGESTPRVPAQKQYGKEREGVCNLKPVREYQGEFAKKNFSEGQHWV